MKSSSEAPVSEAQIRALKVGDVVLINGDMFTGRDAVHAYLMKNAPPVDLHGQVLYHCGPVMLKQGDKWIVKAAGPTTSIREEPYEAHVIGKYGVRVVIGKGGMGKKTLDALKGFGAVYLNGIGGAAQFYARAIKEVKGQYLPEFGIPEAMLASAGREFCRYRHDGCAWQQPARGRRAGDGQAFGGASKGLGGRGADHAAASFFRPRPRRDLPNHHRAALARRVASHRAAFRDCARQFASCARCPTCTFRSLCGCP